MKTIWRFRLEIVGRQVIEVPKGATPLAVQYQAGSAGGPCLWALVDSDEAKYVSWIVRTSGTGHEVPNEGAYFATYQMLTDLGGVFVGHVFLKREE